MEIQPIKTERDYEEVLRTVRELWDAEEDTADEVTLPSSDGRLVGDIGLAPVSWTHPARLWTFRVPWTVPTLKVRLARTPRG